MRRRRDKNAPARHALNTSTRHHVPSSLVFVDASSSQQIRRATISTTGTQAQRRHLARLLPQFVPPTKHFFPLSFAPATGSHRTSSGPFARVSLCRSGPDAVRPSAPRGTLRPAAHHAAQRHDACLISKSADTGQAVSFKRFCVRRRPRRLEIARCLCRAPPGPAAPSRATTGASLPRLRGTAEAARRFLGLAFPRRVESSHAITAPRSRPMRTRAKNAPATPAYDRVSAPQSCSKKKGRDMKIMLAGVHALC